MSDGFWDWAVAAYAAPGVAEECLHLQDVHEQAVPLLLWAAWQAETGRAPDEEALEGAVDMQDEAQFGKRRHAIAQPVCGLLQTIGAERMVQQSLDLARILGLLVGNAEHRVRLGHERAGRETRGSAGLDQGLPVPSGWQ